MKRQDIGFRDLLERLLPLDQLPPADRRAVQSALLSGVGSQIEEAAWLAIRRLEEVGALSRIETSNNGAGPVVRYQARDALRVFTLHLPGPTIEGGVHFVPRASLPARPPAGIALVQRLLRLDEPPARELNTAPTRARLFEQLVATARELLGAVEVRFVPRPGVEPPASEPAIDAALAGRAASAPDLVIHCPDLAAAPRLREAGEREGVGSIVLAGVAAPVGGGAAGHLEVAARRPRFFDDDSLAMVAMLADTFGAALERASRLEQLVFVDPLTSVYNRSYFDLQMQNEMARAQRERASLGLCLCDIDDFKSFNTRFGYEAGNQVLTTVAHTLRGGVRPFDTVSRWGGEEFALLLTPPVTAADARTVSERLRTLVERQRVEVEGLDRRVHELGVTVSVGVALFPDHADSSQELWRAANRALLEAKRPPKNRVVFFDPAMNAQG